MFASTMGKAAKRRGPHPRSPDRRAGDPLSALEARARRTAAGGDLDAALVLYVDLVRQGSMSPDVYSDLGALMAGRGQLAAAIIQFEMALALAPQHQNARGNLLKALESHALEAFEQRRWADAAAGYARLTTLEPDSTTFHNNAGAAFRELKQPDRALAHLRRACALDPARATVHYNLGSVLFDLAEAGCEQALERAIELAPEHVDAHINLGLVNFRMGRLDAAEDCLARALALAPGHGEALGHLASVVREAGRVRESLDLFRAARRSRPASVEIASNHLLARQGDPGATAADLLAESRDWAARFADGLNPTRAPPTATGPTISAATAMEGRPSGASGGGAPGEPRRLRVGYVSADLRSHSVAKFVEPLLEAHDRASFEILAYSDAAPDPTTERLRGLVDRWLDVRRLDDAALATRIAGDAVDILVDLGGHTGSHRLLCFARRPAPVQVSYCGYPGTTGLATMDWRLTDAVADPEDEGDRHGTEQLWRLPNGFLCFRPDLQAGPVAPSPARAKGAVTFGSFNNLAKLTDEVLALWARVLRAIPEARLLLKSRALAQPRAQRRIRERFEALGVASERLELIGYAASTAEHLALYGRVDLGLDPFPYNGTTTTCEALWMGVPVVTLRGTRHAGRVGASLLERVGLGELVAATEDQYVDTCRTLAGDLDRLSRLRSELRPRLAGSPLLSARTITRDIEAAYRHFWQRRARADGT